MESESLKFDDECAQITARLQSMIGEGVGDTLIQKELAELQERYSDYGRDRRSAIDFHISQIRRCLQPTQTTQAFLWIMNSAAEFQVAGTQPVLAEGKRQKVEFWLSLIQELKLTSDQLQQFAQLVSTDKRFSELHSASETSDRMVDRLEELVSNKNESLDHEMAEIQRILSATQIAKFILWIDQNPACMQVIYQHYNYSICCSCL